MKTILAILLFCAALAGCGFQVQAEDLFLLTRTGEGQKLTLLVNYAGTVSCNGGKPKQLPDSTLIQARNLTNTLDGDAQAKLRIARTAHSVYFYTVSTANGTISFPDTAARTHPGLAQLELLTLQIEANPCGIVGA